MNATLSMLDLEWFLGIGLSAVRAAEGPGATATAPGLEPAACPPAPELTWFDPWAPEALWPPTFLHRL
jgi:hypothetical protein